MKEKLVTLNLSGHEVGAEEKVGVNQENTEGGFTSKGEARYQAISKSISGAGKKVFGWLKRGGELFKAGAVGVLSAPEAAVVGGKFVGAKVEEGAEFIDTKAEQAGEWVGNRADQVGEWAAGKANSVYEFSTEKYNETKDFVGTKAEQAGNYVKDKALLVEAVASLATDKTAEKLNVAKEGVVNTYGKAVEYGKDAVNSASLRCQQVKEAYNQKKNAFMETVLQRKAEIQAERLQKTLAKLSQYRMVEGLGNNMAA